MRRATLHMDPLDREVLALRHFEQLTPGEAEKADLLLAGMILLGCAALKMRNELS